MSVLLRRLIATVVVTLAISAPLAVLQATPASAGITTPGNGATVRGVVTITENSGGQDNCSFGSSGWNTRIEVIQDGVVIHNFSKGSGGSYSVGWNTSGRPNGNRYQIKSFGRNSNNGFFTCNAGGEYLISHYSLNLDNRSFSTINAVPSGYANEAVAVSGQVTNEFGGAVSGRTVTLTVDGAGGSVLATTNGSGVYSANVPVNRGSGGTNLRVFTPVGTFESASSNLRGYTVLARPTSLGYVGAGGAQSNDVFLANVQLTDDRLGGAGVGGRTATVSLLDSGSNLISSGVAVTDGSGVAVVALNAAAPAGDYTIDASVPSDAFYIGSSTTAPFTISLRPSDFAFTSAASVYRQELITVGGTLTDVTTGAPLADVPVQLDVSKDGNIIESFALTTDASGAVSTEISPLAAGVYDVAATYLGTVSQGAVTATSTLSVLLRPVTLTIDPIAGDTYSGEAAGLVLHATDDLSAAGINGHALVVRLTDGVTTLAEVSATTGEDGSVSVELPIDVPAGVYSIELSSAETVDYVAGAATGSVDVALRPTALESTTPASSVHGDTGALTAVLTDVRAAAGIEGQDVVFSVDGTEVGAASTDGAGVASLPFTFSADTGTYAVSAAFAGTDRLDGSDTAGSFDIVQRATTLTYDGATSGIRGSTVTLSATLTDTALGTALDGRTVHFSLGSFAADAVTDESGAASVEVPLDQDPGDYTVAVSVDPETNFQGASASAPFSLDWEYTFESALGNGTINLNPSTLEFEIITADGSSGIVEDPGMVIQTTPLGQLVVLTYAGEGLTAIGQLNLVDGVFSVVVSAGGLPVVLAGA